MSASGKLRCSDDRNDQWQVWAVCGRVGVPDTDSTLGPKQSLGDYAAKDWFEPTFTHFCIAANSRFSEPRQLRAEITGQIGFWLIGKRVAFAAPTADVRNALYFERSYSVADGFGAIATSDTIRLRAFRVTS